MEVKCFGWNIYIFNWLIFLIIILHRPKFTEVTEAWPILQLKCFALGTLMCMCLYFIQSVKNPALARRVIIVHLTGQKFEAIVDPCMTGRQLFDAIVTHTALDDFFFFGLTYVCGKNRRSSCGDGRLEFSLEADSFSWAGQLWLGKICVTQ